MNAHWGGAGSFCNGEEASITLVCFKGGDISYDNELRALIDDGFYVSQLVIDPTMSVESTTFTDILVTFRR